VPIDRLGIDGKPRLRFGHHHANTYPGRHGEQHGDAYRAINPRRVVPTLVLEDGTSIGEVPAIFRYLEEICPNPKLLGATAKEKALVTMWKRRAELESFAAVMGGVRNACGA
jgi:glutathione S-transferase